MRKIIFLLVMLTGCGSVQSVNGVRVKGPAKSVRKDVFVGVVSFGAGYYLGKELIKSKR